LKIGHIEMPFLQTLKKGHIFGQEIFFT